MPFRRSKPAAARGGLGQWREQMHQRLIEAADAGVPIVAGSDAAVPGLRFGSGLVAEVEALARAGLGARAALQAATVTAAQVLGRADTGVLAAGRAADLLVVDGDPLADPAALRRVRSVWRAGRAVSAS
ncbi:amidohydrolase family protein [Nocardiopsis coralliicola]